MKTHHTYLKKTIKTKQCLLLCLMTLFAFKGALGQQSEDKSNIDGPSLIVKGIVKNDQGPLPGANILLKGSDLGEVSDINGLFTFNKPLKVGDTLVFSYIGYDIQEVKLNGSNNYLDITLIEEPIQFFGTLNTGIPFRSSRKVID